ncbi:MAG: pantoate--beta-alanine ligase [Candidatus Omnitrophica bacterium]|nr:pantoate--beta-alanine ligase [Candidatus Omnitrophota bacterium]
MKIVRSVQSLRRHLSAARRLGKNIGFVPTMGYFHEGHVSLMRQARLEVEVVVVSIFVNPIQFGPKEDYAKYPRNLKRDVVMARRAGVDILFVPPVEEIYPEGVDDREAMTVVEVPLVSEGLCGAVRPGHFRGVATVVAKLLNMVLPDRMYLGQKDAQQVAVLRKMVSDLAFAVQIRVVPTVRESDGLAMSSRNAYLSREARSKAGALYRALKKAASLVAGGELDAKKIIFAIKKLLLEETGANIEYVSCVSATDFIPVRRIKGKVLIALAVRFPSARLIDNIVVTGK